MGEAGVVSLGPAAWLRTLLVDVEAGQHVSIEAPSQGESAVGCECRTCPHSGCCQLAGTAERATIA